MDGCKHRCVASVGPRPIDHPDQPFRDVDASTEGFCPCGGVGSCGCSAAGYRHSPGQNYTSGRASTHACMDRILTGAGAELVVLSEDCLCCALPWRSSCGSSGACTGRPSRGCGGGAA